jgi:hypothetical protein
MPRDKSDLAPGSAGTALENAGGGPATATSDVPSPPNTALRAATAAAGPPGSPDAALSPSLQEYREARRGPIPQQVDAVPLEVAAPSIGRLRRLDETEPGGRYVDGARLDKETGRYMGGRVADAHNNTLAFFDDNQENTGRVEDGRKPGQG